MDRGVGVLLRVEHPHQQVGELRPAGRPRGGGRPRWSRGRAGRAARRPSSSLVLAAAGVEHRVAGGLVPRRDAEPLEQLVGALAPPDAGGRPRGRRAADADGRELEPGQRVERRGLARPGRAGDRDDGVVGGEPQPAGGPVDDRRGRRRRGRRRAARGRPSAAASRPSMRAPMSVPRVTSLLAPSSKDVIFSLDRRIGACSAANPRASRRHECRTRSPSRCGEPQVVDPPRRRAQPVGARRRSISRASSRSV